MEMTNHQKRLWQNMIDMIQHYLNEETNDFYDLVGKLEGALDAADIKDKELVSKWYDFWTPLETRRAVQGNNIDKEKAIKELNMMKDFLLKTTYKISMEDN
jgi:L-rhamnose mutarotase